MCIRDSAEVFKLSKIEEGTIGSLTFLSNPKYQNFIYSTEASVTIVNKTFEPEQAISTTSVSYTHLDVYKRQLLFTKFNLTRNGFTIWTI